MKEYKTQSIYIFIGLVVLLFPFFNVYIFIPAFFFGALIFSRIKPDSGIFGLLARESDIRAGKLTGLTRIFLTTGVLFLICSIVGIGKFPVFIIGGALAITTFGDGVADMINIHDRRQSSVKVYSARSSIVFLISGGIFAFLASAWILKYGLYQEVPYELVFFLAVIGAVTGALLETMTYYEDHIIIPFGSAMTMWLFYTFRFGYMVEWVYLIKVLGFAFVLGYLAYRVRIADISAMLSATLLGVIIIISTDIKWYVILLAFFLLGGFFTRYKYDFKKARGIAESKGGVRGYKNVFSNSLAALALAVAYKVFFPSHAMLLLSAYLGSIATATGDTLASEIGQTWKGEPRMITTFKKVRPGTDGGVTALGEFAAFAGSGAIAILSLMFFNDDIGIENVARLVLIVLAGGFIGTNIDSVLGATLQQKGYLSNNGVNLVATISGAIVSAILFVSLGS